MTSQPKQCSNGSQGALLARYELGTLNEAERNRFEEHLLDCQFCSDALMEMLPLMATLRQNRQAIVSSLHRDGISFNALREELLAEARIPRVRLWSRAGELFNQLRAAFARPVVWAPAALCAAAALLLVMQLQKQPSFTADHYGLTFKKAPYEAQVWRGEPADAAVESFNQGMQSYLANDYASAIKLLKKAVALEPERGTWWMFLGISSYLDRRAPDAVAALTRAVALTEYDLKTESLWYLAQAHVLDGHKDQALPLLKQLSEQQNPYSGEAHDLLNRISQEDIHK
jgi:tetratricopeptide (TPR) repeat protein